MNAAASKVARTRKRIDALLALVPNKRYSESNAAEKRAFDRLSVALKRHREAVRARDNKT